MPNLVKLPPARDVRTGDSPVGIYNDQLRKDVAMSAPIAQGKGRSPFIKAEPDSFWQKVGIHPPAAAEFNGSQQGQTAAKTALIALGRGNLRTLCESSLLPYDAEGDEARLAQTLLAAADIPTILHLREFLKRKTEWVDRAYQDVFTQRQRRGHAANIEQLSKSSRETLKSLTKLFLIYRKRPAALLDVYIYEAWNKRSTSFEYLLTDHDGKSISKLVTKNISRLIHRFEQVTRRGVSALATHTLPSGLTVWIFLREYGSKVRRDYDSQYQVVNDCGLIVVGYDPDEQRLHFRSGNRQLAVALEQFFSHELSIDLRLLHNQVFADYDPTAVRDAFLGTYSPEHGIEILAARLSRTALPGRGSIALEAGFMQRSIRDDLALLNSVDYSLLDIRGPVDIESLTLSFKGKTAVVQARVDKGGAVRMAFDNAGWTIDDEREFEVAFHKTFGLPINRQIDPSVVPMGNVNLIAFLLRVTNADEIEGYHQQVFDALCDKGYLDRNRHVVKGCQNNLCRERGKPVSDRERETCRVCDHTLDQWAVTGITRNEPEILALVKSVVERATGRVLGTEQSQVESTRYHALSDSAGNGDEEPISVLFADRATVQSRHVFERASRPIVIVQPHTDRRVFVDFDNIGHISLAYVIAAQDSASEHAECDRRIRDMVQRLLLTNKERIEKAARHSYSILIGQRDGLTGAGYETEMFNLLRVIFPYSFRLGRIGKEEPDGFATIPDYRGIENIEDAKGWHFTYDAKFSNASSGYDFGADERRQMLHYISRFARSRQALSGRSGAYRAHVIISNRLDDSKMAKAMKFLRGQDGLKGKAASTRVIFMTEEFVLRLFEWMQANPVEAAQRRAHLFEALISLFEGECAQTHCKIDATDVDSLIKSIRSIEVVETRVNRTQLTSALDDDSLLV